MYTYSIIYIYIPYIPPYPTITFWLSPCSMANPMFVQSRRAGSGLSRHACTDLQPRSPQRLGWSNLIHKSIRYIPSCGQTLTTYHISYIILSWKPSCCKKKHFFLQYVSFRFLLQTANIAAARHQFHVVRLMLTWHLPRLRKGYKEYVGQARICR